MSQHAYGIVRYSHARVTINVLNQPCAKKTDLFCIGFYLPMEVSLRKKEFKDEFIFPMLPSLKKHILPRC